MSYHQVLKKEVYYYVGNMRKNGGNALENWQICTYFFENVWEGIQYYFWWCVGNRTVENGAKIL